VTKTPRPVVPITWDRFVDCVTVIWLGLFVLDIAKPNLIPTAVEFSLLSVFVGDLVIKYCEEPNLSSFIRKRWGDIFMAVPYFRIFRILRLIRLLRVLRAARIARAGRFPGLKTLETFRRKSTRMVRRYSTRVSNKR